MSKKFVAYYRQSSKRQERSGLGIEAQKTVVADLTREGELVAEFTETASGSRADRRIVARAIAKARDEGAILVIAKIDRLARDAGFLMALKSSGLEFVAGDMPELNTLSLGVLATVAQAELERISQRQREIKAELKREGKPIGGLCKGQAPKRAIRKSLEVRRQNAMENPHSLRSRKTVELLLKEGKSLNAIARWLNEIGESTPRGKVHTAASVSRLCDLYGLEKPTKSSKS